MREGPGTASTEAAPGPSAVRTWGPLVTLWIVWGTTFLGTSAMVQTMPPLLAAGARYAIGGVLLAGVLVVVKGPRVLAITRRQLGTTAFAGVGIIGIWASLVALALQHIPGGVAALIGATVPLWVVLLRVISGDRVGWRTALGVAVGMVGVAAMLLPGGIAPLAAESPATVAFWAAMMVVASMTYACFSWRSRSLDLPSNSLVTTVYQLLWGGLAIILVGLVVREEPVLTGYSGVSWAGFWWLVVASIIGYGAYTFLLQNVPLSLVSTFAFVNPVVAVLLGWLLLGEPFTRSVVIGLLVVVTGTALVVVGEERRAG
ncbi:MAG: EamA family transporter [Candidatus Nanopelagicales bacterium]